MFLQAVVAKPSIWIEACIRSLVAATNARTSALALAFAEKLDESRDLAKMVQTSMVRHLGPHNRDLKDLGVKQAPFVVLIGAGMPSVLAEISFVTHEREGQLLRTPTYRQKIAEALFDAVLKYQRSLKAVGTLAAQEE